MASNKVKFRGKSFTESDFQGIPLNVTALWGDGKGHFELTGGVAIGVWREDGNPENPGVFPLVDVGYRYEARKGGLIFRAKTLFAQNQMNS